MPQWHQESSGSFRNPFLLTKGIPIAVGHIPLDNLEIEKKRIELPEAIHQTGEYEVIVSLHAEAGARLKVIVEREEG